MASAMALATASSGQLVRMSSFSIGEFYSSLLEQPAPGQAQGDGEGDGTGRQQHADVQRRVGRPLAGKQRPDQCDALGQRQPAADGGKPAGQLFGREEDPGNRNNFV